MVTKEGKKRKREERKEVVREVFSRQERSTDQRGGAGMGARTKYLTTANRLGGQVGTGVTGLPTTHPYL